ncbi:MAG: IS256 family transposase [Clostridiaceae bacterium]|jgi:transposase-like protein|nr:IS256 family transposase [Clostridiaceae bacterium]
MTQLNITLSEATLKELMIGDRDEAVRELLEAVFNAVLKAEVSEQVGAESYERTDKRLTYRNGYRERQFKTRVGTLDLFIPKLRNGTFSTALFANYERSEKALVLSLMEMVLQGVSTRKVSRITETLCGTSFSKSTVSRLCEELDKEVEQFRQRPLTNAYPFLIVDAIYVKARANGSVKSKGLLVAIGVNEDGHREVLGFKAGDGESYEIWFDFFSELKEQGLHGVDLVTSDQHKGLVKAIREQFEGASWQRCQTHFSRNVLDKVPKKTQREVQLRLKDIYNSPELEEARVRKEALLDYLEEHAPRAVESFDDGFDDITAVFQLPEVCRRRLRTSNSLERVNQELRRRERVIRIFPNEASIERLLGSLLIEMHENWISGRKYIDTKAYYEACDNFSNSSAELLEKQAA